jgi:L-lactate dehydrogenase (cytochrome)/(S)-mandelate dehydrogenase
MWHHGEIALAKAAAAAGLPFTLSTASLTSIERIAAEAPGRLWFQLYMWPDRAMSHDLVRRVQAAGFEALMVTLDTAVSPNRECNVRNGFVLPFRINQRNALDIALHPRWLSSVVLRYLLDTGMPRFENFPEALQRTLTASPKGRSALPKNDALTWADLRTLRGIWKGPLIVKGILHPDDAEEAVQCGADAVIVSNHGGRNLDASVAPLFALPDIVARVDRRAEVYMDGGVMRGSDIIKALALGAQAVLVGRAPLWGVAVAGQAGATRALEILGEESLRVLGQLGCASIQELGPELLWSGSAPLPRTSLTAPPP